MSHPRGVGLDDADDGVHALRGDPQTGADAAHRGVGRGHKGIGALEQQREVEHNLNGRN